MAAYTREELMKALSPIHTSKARVENAAFDLFSVIITDGVDSFANVFFQTKPGLTAEDFLGMFIRTVLVNPEEHTFRTAGYEMVARVMLDPTGNTNRLTIFTATQEYIYDPVTGNFGLSNAGVYGDEAIDLADDLSDLDTLSGDPPPGSNSL